MGYLEEIERLSKQRGGGGQIFLRLRSPEAKRARLREKR